MSVPVICGGFSGCRTPSSFAYMPLLADMPAVPSPSPAAAAITGRFAAIDPPPWTMEEPARIFRAPREDPRYLLTDETCQDHCEVRRRSTSPPFWRQ